MLFTVFLRKSHIREKSGSWDKGQNALSLSDCRIFISITSLEQNNGRKSNFKFRKTKNYFNNYWVEVLKNWHGHGTLKSTISKIMNWADFLHVGVHLRKLKVSLISWIYVLHGLPSLDVNLNEPSIAMWVFYVNSTCPNHLSLVWCKSSTVLATPSLLLNSIDDFPSLRQTLYIYHTICMSVQEIRLISLSFRGKTSLPYIITLLMQAVCTFPLLM